MFATTFCSNYVQGAVSDTDFFEKKIRPILAENCYECHSAASKKLKGGLRVDSLAGLLKGGETGPAIVPGKPEASLLYLAITHHDKDLTMPPKKPKLSEAILADVGRWIQDGAIWPGREAAAPVAKADGFDLAARKQRLSWIWETPRRQIAPSVTNTNWPLNSVDRFILQRLEKEGLRPAPPAEPQIWLRRVYFALIGLPPSPEELAAFLKDRSADARAWVVDQLLASPHFGERWARHWLDLVRYAESRGHESDYIIPNAYEYRDYVVRAFNADVPYDKLVREHIAGDLMPAPRRNLEKGFNESILGTGWAFLGEELHAPVDTRLDENDRIDNRIDVMAKTFLGLTVSCARCHDHKFDAISQRDYYALAGFFLSSGQRLARFETIENNREMARQLDVLKQHWAGTIASKMAEAQAPVLLNLKGYLSAAAEVIQAGSIVAPVAGKRAHPADFPEAIRKALQQLAAERSLDSNILAQWTAAVLNAVPDKNDALHPFARMTSSKESQKDLLSLPSSEIELPNGARLVVDFGKLASHDWMADGFGFGLQPAQSGELQVVFRPGTNGTILRIISRGSAQTDLDWQRLDLSSEVEHEPTLYGSWKRDGVMVRTPKFEITNGKMQYLVRGSGRIFAAVDSQRLVTGPLHTLLVKEWGFKDGWHWVAQDLSEYKGHRVEIEFSPGNEFDTAISMIVESEKAPPDPPTLGQRLGQILVDHKVQPDIGEAAAAYQEILIAASKASCSRASVGSASEIANWLAQHPELFSGKEGVLPESVAQAVREFSTEREPLLSRIQWKSRTAPAMMEGNGVDEYLLVRGKHQTPKGLVPRRFLEAISGLEPIGCSQGSGRGQLAGLMTDRTNPLLARVLVNRVWHHLFGRGIVASVDNFGWLGQRPTHPELLDELAASFMEEDRWSIKRLIRRLALSRTYGMSSKPSQSEAEQRDPENLLLHRMNLKRLEGEAIRDAILTVSGRLDQRMFGPSVPLHPSQFIEARGLRSERGPLDGDGRRSLYLAARRNFLPMMMSAFDTPTPFTTVGRRNISNVPGQMLFLMNDPFVHQQAEAWARRIEFEMPGASAEERMQRLFLAAFSRDPSATELKRCLAMLRQVEEMPGSGAAKPDPWMEVCDSLFGVKEFIYVR